MKNIFLTLLLLLTTFFSFGHIGNTGTQMQGQAGPYRVLVNITPPEAVPGSAKVNIHIENEDNFSVSARAIGFQMGDQGASAIKKIKRDGKKIGYFHGDIWIEEQGSNGIQLYIDGSEGKGSIIVPIVALSTTVPPMPLFLRIGLGLLATILLVLLFAIFGTILNAILSPLGYTFLSKIQIKNRIKFGVYVLVTVLLLFAGSRWWNSKEISYKNNFYQPITAHSDIILKNELPVFQLKIDSTNWGVKQKGNVLSTLIPDHGKLMHTFLIRTPSLDVFTHLHTKRIDSLTFEAPLPNIPVGKYLVYSDIMDYSGFTQTIVDTIDINIRYNIPEDKLHIGIDDAYIITDPIDAPGRVPIDDNVVICGQPGTKTVFSDGSFAIWEGKPDKALEVGKTYALNFEMFNPDGSKCLPEPYMGMMGHAVVLKTDGLVFNHLHPSGSHPLSSEKVFKKRMTDSSSIFKKPNSSLFKDSVDTYLSELESMSMIDREIYLMTEMGMYETNENGMMGMDHSNQILFPYTFTQAGRYRIYLQVKRNEKILTGVFDAKVANPPKK